MKTIKFFPKATEKIDARGIGLQDVSQTCFYPEQTLRGRKGRKIAQRKLLNPERKKQYLLRVIFEESEEEIKVVTAYKTSKIKKYWRDEK